MPELTGAYAVELPAGGVLHLQTAEEVDLWETSKKRYFEEYVFGKTNDLVALGTLLQQQINLYRAQTAINGMVPERDSRGVPTGRYKSQVLDAADIANHQKVLTEAAKEMRALEKSLGIDKAKRESGGTHTVDDYITQLKKAAHLRGIHVVKRTLEYENFANDLRWRIRMLFHSDPEDRQYHNITPKTVLTWVDQELRRLEQVDKDHAKEHGQLYAGKL